VRLIASLVVSLITAAIALLVAALVLDDFSISGTAFPIVVVVFAVVNLVARAVAESMVRRHAHVLSSLAGLIGIYVALLITDLVSDGLDVEGVGTWALATLIIWLGMIAANILLAARMFRAITGRDRR
jgi:hypothetical protein